MERVIEIPTGTTLQKNETRLNIISENTLVSAGNSNNEDWSYNRYWYREFTIPSQMIRGKQDIHLVWSLNSDDQRRPSQEIEDLRVKLLIQNNV